MKLFLWKLFLADGSYKIKLGGTSMVAYWNGIFWSNKFRLDNSKVGLFVRMVSHD